MDSILWTLRRSDGIELLGALWRPFLVAVVLYYSGYLAVWLTTLARAARVVPLFRGIGPAAPDVLLVLPTLVNGRKDLDQLRAAATTVIGNGYPGRLVVCLAIDGADDNAALLDELEAWARRDRGPRATVLVARVPKRAGKGVAVAAGLERAQEAIRRGELSRLPPVFFNMDADGVLGARALERMVAKLVTPGWLTRQRPMIVASNVMVRKAHYWQGVGKFFTLRYQLALQVAREYMTSISISRNNRGILPVTGVSGALYCTWTELHVQQGRHAAFMLSLRKRELVRWWLGAEPPSFARFTGPPNTHATAGPGDDTWTAWLAMSARWRDGRIDLELPRSPLHALGRLARSFVVRPIAYDPLARVYTATPTTVRGLFKQRLRWNASRHWLIQRWGLMPWFQWQLGAWVFLNAAVVVGIHLMILIGVVAWPFSDRPAIWLAILVLAYVGTLISRLFATLLAMAQDHDLRGHRHKLLALPLAGVYHVVFNIATTVVGLIHEILLFGLDTKFAPETTLAASRTGRIAIGYRLCRAARLTARALRHGDVAPGRFWFGWWSTPWTAHGYTGWTDPARRIGRGGVVPRRRS